MVNQNVQVQRDARRKLFDDFHFELEKMKIEFLENYSEGPKRKTDTVTNLSDFNIIATLGEGSFGSVILGKHKTSKNYYAIKVMSKEQILRDKQFQHTLDEKQILCSVKFPFLIHMEFNFKDNCNIFFVLPFLAGGDMFSLLRKHKNLKEKDAKFYAAQVVLALEYLHYMDILYRDLKPENIVVNINGYIKITDFGFCKVVKLRTYTLCGTPEYLAPEIILSKGYGKAVDWWSFGIFLFEMIAGYTPFYTDDIMEIYEKITVGKYKFSSHFSSDARNLIKNILQIDLSRRYGNLKDGVLDIKGHEWFKLVDWNSILSCKAVAPFLPAVDSPGDTSNFDYFCAYTIQESRSEKFVEEFKDF